MDELLDARVCNDTRQPRSTADPTPLDIHETVGMTSSLLPDMIFSTFSRASSLPPLRRGPFVRAWCRLRIAATSWPVAFCRAGGSAVGAKPAESDSL